MLVIETSRHCIEEKNYIFSIVFSEFLSCWYKVYYTSAQKTVLVYRDGRLELPDIFFQSVQDIWPEWPSDCLDRFELFDTSGTSLSEDLPIWIGRPYCNINGKNISCEIDLLGTIFVLLNRYEELTVKDKDQHGRCAAKKLTIGGNFVHRPLVDEYVELLQYYLLKIGLVIKEKKSTYTKFLTCDVDRPFLHYPYSLRKTILHAGADIFLRRSASSLSETIRQRMRAMAHGVEGDPLFTFEYLMDCMEHAGVSGTFYFLTSPTGHKLDGDYDVSDTRIRSLIQRIVARGHNIGLHGSYNSYNDQSILSRELSHLQSVVTPSSGKPVLEVRQHVLRWQANITPQIQANCGLISDSSLAFAEIAGFRSGTTREYLMYDLKNRKTLTIKQRPLTVMDCSLLEPAYMNFDHQKAFNYVKSLFDYTKKYSGTFTLLWHNSYLNSDADKELFEAIVEL